MYSKLIANSFFCSCPFVFQFLGSHYCTYHQSTLLLESAVLTHDYLSPSLQQLCRDEHQRNSYAAEGLEFLAQLQDKREVSKSYVGIGIHFCHLVRYAVMNCVLQFPGFLAAMLILHYE